MGSEIIQPKVDVRNSNELNFVGNAVGKEAIEKKVDKHFDKVVDRVVSQQDNGKLDELKRALLSGQGLTTKQHEELEKIAEVLTPKELTRLAKSGAISESNANFLIMADSFKDAGVSGDAMSRGLTAFFNLPPLAQDFAIEVMSDRSSERKVKAENKSDLWGLVRKDSIKSSEKEEKLSLQQERLVTFLTVPRNGPGDINHFVGGHFDSSRDTLAAALGDLPTFRNMEPDQQAGLLDYFQQLGRPGPHGPRPHDGPRHEGPRGEHPHGPDDVRGEGVPYREGPRGPGGEHPHGPGDMRPEGVPYREGPHPGGPPKLDILGPEDLKNMGFSDNEVVDLATLMFQVMADRISTLDQQVRTYAEGVQQKNNELKTLNNAMTALRADAGNKKSADLSETTFKDASGKETSLALYLADNDIIKVDKDLTGSERLEAAQDKLKKVDSVKVDSILASLKSKSDVLSTESTQAMTKLQQAMDKFNQSTTQQSQLESKFNTLKMTINNKLGQ